MMSNEWIEHDGKDMPVPGDTKVQVKLRGGFGDHFAISAEYWHGEDPATSNWLHTERERSYEIVAYRVVP